MARRALALLLVAACARSDRPMLLAAASLGRVLPEILGEEPVRTSYAATSMLARQIERGLDADVFVSADRLWVDHLKEGGIGVREAVFARNRLVAWVRAGEGGDWGDLRRIAVGAEGVPVGRYARDALEGRGLEDRLLPCRDAPAVIAALLAGEADAAIAYATDGDERCEIAFELDQPVTYWVLLCRERPAAERLFATLTSDRARAILMRRGFR